MGKESQKTMDDGKAFQQIMQRLAKVLARAMVGYNFKFNLSPCPLMIGGNLGESMTAKLLIIL